MTTVFVAGGAGGVGTGIVRAWLDHGATVVTTSRDVERLRALRNEADGADGVLIAESSDADAATFERLADAHGPFDSVVASIGGGGWQLAPLADIDESMLRRVVDDGIVAHWRTAATLRPHVRDGGSYVFVNGGAADEIIPGTGPLSLVARAQLTLAEIFDREGSGRIRTFSLVLTSPIATRARGNDVQPEWLTPKDVGDACRRLHLGPLHGREIRISTRADIETLTAPRA